MNKWCFIVICLIIGSKVDAQQCFDCKSSMPINNGLVLCLPFNGSSQDLSGFNFNSNNIGALYNPDRCNNPNGALSFNGSNQFVRLGDILDTMFCKSVAQFSVSGWAKSNSWAPWQGGGLIVGKASGGVTNAYQWQIFHDVDGKVSATICSDRNANNFIEVKSGVIPTGQWFHFVYVFDGSLPETQRLKLYINAVQGTISRDIGILGTSTEDTNQEITIGAGHDVGNSTSPNNQYNGSIEEIRIYNRALTFADVTQLHQQKSKSVISVSKDTTILVGDSAELWATGASGFMWHPKTGLSSSKGAIIKASPLVNTSYKVVPDTLSCTCSDSQTVNITVAYPACETCKTVSPINNGLVLCFPFNGNANDESGSGNHGTVGGATLTSDRNGVPNAAYLFDGVNDYIDLSKNLNDMTVTTFCAWIKPQGNVSQAGMIFYDGNSMCGNDYAIVYQNGKVGVRADKSGAVMDGWASSPGERASLPSNFFNQWSFVVWVMEPSVSSIYINGVLVKQINKTGSNVGYHYLPSIGSFYDTGNPPCGSPRSTFFNGVIDDIRFYDRALSLTEIAQLYALDESLKINTSPDVFINNGDSAQVWATAYPNASYSWQPTTGLSNAAIPNPKASPPQTTTYVVTVKKGNCEKNDTVIVYVNENKNCTYVNLLNRPNLVQNGDFEAGNTGFNTPLSPFVSPPLNAGQYVVVNDASTVHFGYKQKDHTSGSGNFMVINAPNFATNVWCQTVTVKPNTFYRYSAWLNSVVDHVNFPGTPNAKVELHINGQKVSKNVTITDLPDEWILLDTLWFSGSATTANLCVYDIATDGNGNDFGLDDITFKECECTITVDAGLDVAGCAGDSVQLNATSDVGALSWFPTTGLSNSTLLTPKLKVQQDTIYYLTVQNGNCVAKDSIKVTINPLPMLNVGTDTVKCALDTLQLQASSTLRAKLRWFPSTGLTSDSIAQPMCFVSQSTGYNIIATDTVSGCKSSDSLYVKVSKPIAAFTPSTISGSKPLKVLFNNSSLPATAKFLWDFGDTSLTSTDKDPEYTYNKKGVFKVLLTVTDSNGCIDTVSSGIEVFEQVKFFIPNVFSPNGDNINDAFMAVYEASLIKQVKGSIWNRWGGLVYQFELPNGKWWDGTSSGQLCTDGVYVYIIEFTGIDNRIYKFNGLVTLLR